MKKTFFSCLLLAALTVTGNAQVKIDAGYATDFTIAGTARAEDSAYLGITGVKNIAEGLNAYGFNYLVPGNFSRADDSALDASQNHAGLGLAYDVNSLGAFSFTLDGQAVYHVVNGPLGDSFQYSLGATFDSLPVLGEVSDLTIAFIDDVDLDINGVQVELSRKYNVWETLSITPAIGHYAMNDYDATYAGATLTYEATDWKPYVNLRYLDNDADGLLAVDSDTQISAGIKFNF